MIMDWRYFDAALRRPPCLVQPVCSAHSSSGVLVGGRDRVRPIQCTVDKAVAELLPVRLPDIPAVEQGQLDGFRPSLGDPLQ